jgi:hypothetical protein
VIIKYPTGLYASVLPSGPQDAGDVTFTISSTVPPRSDLLFPKIPPGVSNRPRPQRTITAVTRRNALGQLVYTINQASRSATASSLQVYEVGQVLEFGTFTPSLPLTPFFAGSSSEIRHDTGLLDYTRLGFSSDQQATVQAYGNATYSAQEQLLVAARQNYSNIQVAISENQKTYTEAGKALDALIAMSSVDPVILAMIADLTARRLSLNSERGTLVNQANQVATVASGLLAQIRSLAQVVR